MSPRTQKAIEVLKQGGCFRRALETQYRGNEQFEYRLRDKSGQVVKGFGFATFHELETSGMLPYRACPSSTVYPTEYVLKGA